MTRRSNCLLWAVLLYLRRRAKGKPGYLMLRRSRCIASWRAAEYFAVLRYMLSLRGLVITC